MQKRYQKTVKNAMQATQQIKVWLTSKSGIMQPDPFSSEHGTAASPMEQHGHSKTLRIICKSIPVRKKSMAASVDDRNVAPVSDGIKRTE